MATQVSVLVGTTKGVFLLGSDVARRNWRVRGPFCEGWPINHVIADADTGVIWAAGGSEWTGAGVWSSADNGDTWTLSKLSNGKFDEWLTNDPALAAEIGQQPDPPAPFTGTVDALWSLALAGTTLLAGAKPAALFASTDGGQSWDRLEALSRHPSAPEWQPGGAGLVLHSIVADPDDPARLWVAISAAGVFASEDGGQSWDRRNQLSNAAAEANAHHHPGANGHETGHCVHNLQRAAALGGKTGPGGKAEVGDDLLYQQNHHGVFRSPDGGRTWHDITAGLPSNFGFPIAVHPRDPETVWVLPLNGDMAGRYPPDAAAAVWRTRRGGEEWQALRNGLPGQDCFFTVLRQAMATDRADPVGIYFGTNSGSVFASANEGDHWAEIARHLPTVLSVEVLERG